MTNNIQNHIEFEGKILEINPSKIIEKLKRHGVKKILDATTYIETYDMASPSLFKKTTKKHPAKFSPILNELHELIRNNKNLIDQHAYLRLRQEGRRCELILKYPNKSDNHIKAEREISVKISQQEWVYVQKMMKNFGFVQRFYQEKKRTSYIIEKMGLRFDLDTWPGVPTYVEIEGGRKSDIVAGAKFIGHKPQELQSIKAMELFKQYSVCPIYLSFEKGGVTVELKKVSSAMQNAIMQKGISKHNASFITRHYLEAELVGKAPHGLRKLCWDLQFYHDRENTPQIIADNKTMLLVDGKKEVGPLAARFCTKLVIERAKKHGMALVCMKNAQRFGMLSTWSKMIADAGLIGLVTNSTEPFVAPYGGTSGVLGTNPISIAIPSAKEPIIFDAATSKAPMNLVWYSKSLDLELPEKAFFDIAGNHTQDPNKALFVETFNGKKGFGLSFMLQVLSGPFVTVKTDTSFTDPYEVGFFFQAIDPAVFQSLKNFKERVAAMVKRIKSAKKKKGVKMIYVPGEVSKKKGEQTKKAGVLTLPKTTWNWLQFLKENPF